MFLIKDKIIDIFKENQNNLTCKFRLQMADNYSILAMIMQLFHSGEKLNSIIWGNSFLTVIKINVNFYPWNIGCRNYWKKKSKYRDKRCLLSGQKLILKMIDLNIRRKKCRLLLIFNFKAQIFQLISMKRCC